MNLMMTYRPLHSQSRVEFIKKKFENSFSAENEKGSLKNSSATIAYNSKVLQELRGLNLDKNSSNKNSFLKDGSAPELHDISKTEGRALVKRTPAFRREKLGCSKSLTPTTCQKPVNTVGVVPKNEHESQKLNFQHNNLVTREGEDNTFIIIKRSKTDTNLLKYCTKKNSNKSILRSPSLSKNCDFLHSSHNFDNQCHLNREDLPEYSVINKNRGDTRATGSLKFSDSIRRALQSPLPKGPPPKKPPRTFCHVPQNACQSEQNKNCEINYDCNAKRTVPKVDIPKLKSKLEKLEKAIKIHETGGQIKKFVENKEKRKDTIRGKPEKSSGQDITSTASYCLPFSRCFNQGNNCLTKVSKKNCEFYIDPNKKDSELSECENNGEGSSETTSDKTQVKIISTEVIYDLPFVNKKNNFGTFGKCLKESGHAKRQEESLHYLCTDVIKHAPTSPDFFKNCDRRKSLDGTSRVEVLNPKANPVTSPEKLMSSSMNRIDDAKNIVSDSRKRKENEKETGERTEASSVPSSCGSGSVESGLDSVPVTRNWPAAADNVSQEMEAERQTDAQGSSQIVLKKKAYLSGLSFNQTPYWKYKNSESYSHLFEYCLLVGLTLCESKKNVPYIKSIFPPDMKPPPSIESLCFPDASLWPPDSEDQKQEEQYYSLVVTNENGERKFGYCRRVLPEGGHFCLPLTYCIISPHRAAGFFYKVLEELESRHGSPGIENFIRQLYESHFPGPGERLKLKEILEEATRVTLPTADQYLSSTLVRRPCDIRLEEKDLTQLLQHLQLSVFLKVFSSLLHERKVLFLSNSLRKLSSCIEALQSVLLPFSWQHTYIPVLPVHMIEMCEAPTPYVIGLLKPKKVEKMLSNVNFEDGIVVDLDDSKILKCCGDEGNILPQRFTKDLKTSLNLAMSATDLSDSVRSVLLSDAFIRFFVQVCGNYSKFILTPPSGEKIFRKDDFVKSMTSNTAHSFLQWFTETAMFNSFIQERLQGEEEDTLIKLFRLRAMEYSGDSVKDSAALLRNYRALNKKAKTLGDKIKDFTSFSHLAK